MNSETQEKMLTVAELAKRLDVGQDKARAMAKRGEVPSYKVGRELRFDWAECVEALRAPKTGAVA